MLSADKVNRRYFRKAYLTGRHGWSAEEPSPHVVKFLKRMAGEIPGGELLDVGCGEGRHAIAAAGLGFEVTAIDYEPLALRRARRIARAKGAAGITFRKADIFHLPFRPGRFDAALDCGCLHHQRKSEWPAYKAAILRVLKPGGYFALSVFSPRFYMFRRGGRPWHISQGAYRRCFRPKDIAGLFGREFDILRLVEERDAQRGFWHALMKHKGEVGS
ncbi:MAG: class I SAM-dependent methyltransferase [Planctomycetota bacterium]|jgi:SAM-dependent methyltransferase